MLTRGGPANPGDRAGEVQEILGEAYRSSPTILRLVIENSLRGVGDEDGRTRLRSETEALLSGAACSFELAPDRIVLPDSSGLPVLMDLAALRDWQMERGADPKTVEPMLPVDVVIDHSLIVEHAGSSDAEKLNIAVEYRRNRERYSFLKWAGNAFEKVRIVPPGRGIIHQINLERLANVVVEDPARPGLICGPELVLGCDSHTPMINALGVLGWGVGGIEAEAALVGLPYTLAASSLVGVRLSGSLPATSTITDLALYLTSRLREADVTGALVEFFGPGAATLSVFDRATIANMAPEYGSTTGFFAFDRRTVEFLTMSGRDTERVQRISEFMVDSGFAAKEQYRPSFPRLVEIDLSECVPSVAGPARPQDYCKLSELSRSAVASQNIGGFDQLSNGSVILAAITSCTNTANPGSIIAAALLARNASRTGLSARPWIKTSFAPGSLVVDRYLKELGLQKQLDQLGFQIVGHGCTTCSGKSGPIAPDIAQQIKEKDLTTVAVLSGNRNFPGRIHKLARQNFIMSPALVVAYAIAGNIEFDFEHSPLGQNEKGKDIYLRDIWPDRGEIEELCAQSQRPDLYRDAYDGLYDGNEHWAGLPAPLGPVFPWDETSEYLKKPPFFASFAEGVDADVVRARVLLVLGDDLTTDQITPSGEIVPDSAAGKYLLSKGVAQNDFNAVTQRRGNHEVMRRVTFANQRIRNALAGGPEGGLTRIVPEGPLLTIHEAAGTLVEDGHDLLVIAGRNYGAGSSRDWAAKGPWMLGIRAVLARSFERIHRKNLVCMGILPLRFQEGQSAGTLGLMGFEEFDITGIHEAIHNSAPVNVLAKRSGKTAAVFQMQLDILGATEADLILQGGVFPTIQSRLREQGKRNGL